MGRIQGVPNKVTTAVKGQLQSLMEQAVNSIDVDSMDTNQKIKLLQITSQYVLPRLKAVYKENNDMNKQDIIIDIVKTDEDGNNYVDSTYRNGELVSSSNNEY